MCMKFNFISICTYLCGVCPMYCSLSNYFRPNVFGDHIVLECCFRYIGDALDAWFIHIEVWWPNNYWNQARVIEELLSTTPYQCYLGNKYLLMHTFSSIQPCGLHHGMNLFICKWFASCKGLNETSLLQMWVSWDECI